MSAAKSKVESWWDEETRVKSPEPEFEIPQKIYSNRLVAWIDILGMRNMIKSEENEAETIFGVMEKLRSFVQTPCANLAKEGKLHYTQIADGFMIVADVECATEFCSILADVQWRVFVECQMLLRGAVTAGKVSVSEDPQIIIGPAYVDAYMLESESAIYPRVILTDEFFDATKKEIIFWDNGYGIPSEEFISKMRSIGDSQKGFHNDQIGFRGIGRLSAMPFCDKLEFQNKVKGSSQIQTFSWNGQEYAKLLLQEKDHDLSAAINDISQPDVLVYSGNNEDHFFKVSIVNYHEEIEELINSDDFVKQLRMMLPLHYSPTFTAQNVIKQEYENLMNKSLDRFGYDIRLDDAPLYKLYEDQHILESGIVFWPLQFKAKSDDLPAEKIGLLWFTFNRRVTANPTSEPRGIMVRSKNMLVGNNDSLADAVSVNSRDYVATYRELTQSLAGVYGEMLLYTSSLEDNARRDWFKISASSIELRGIIAEFLRRLISYRYAASRAFNDKSSAKKKENLITTYTELTQGIKQEQFLSNFYAQEQSPENTPDNIFEYADDDLPRASITIKRFYDRTLGTLRDFYAEENDLQNFFKMRAYLKKRLNEETKK